MEQSVFEGYDHLSHNRLGLQNRRLSKNETEAKEEENVLRRLWRLSFIITSMIPLDCTAALIFSFSKSLVNILIFYTKSLM